MPGFVGIPRAPEADLRVRRAFQGLTAFNKLLLGGSLVFDGDQGVKLNITVADLPATVVVQSELDAAIAALFDVYPVALFDHFADGDSVNTDGTEDDLYANLVPADLLGGDGDKLEAWYVLNLVGSATATRQVQLYFGGALVLDTGSLTVASGATISIHLSVIRDGADSVRVVTELEVTGITFQQLVTYTPIGSLDFTGALPLVLTGIAAGVGAAPADISAGAGSVKFWPAVV